MTTIRPAQFSDTNRTAQAPASDVSAGPAPANGPRPRDPADDAPATPESTATDQATRQFQSARQSLASMQQLAQQGRNFAEAELQDGYLQQNVETARASVEDALATEIAALVEADPSLDQNAALRVILDRYSDDPNLQSELRETGNEALVDAAADEILSQVPETNDPISDLYGLDAALVNVPAQVRERVLSDPRTDALIDRAAAAATQPIQPYLEPGDQRSGETTEDIRQALIGLEQASAGLGPALAGALVDRALDDFERLQTSELGGADIISGPSNTGDYSGNSWVQLVRIASHVHGAENGQGLIDRLIDLNSEGEGWEYALDAIDTGAGQDPLLGNPVGPALFVALERRGIPLTANGEPAAVYAMGPIQAAIDGPIQSSAESYYQLTETMQVAQRMRPLFASEGEYNAAVAQLMTQTLGADWEQQIQTQQQQLANDGSLLLSQLSQFMSLPPGSPMRGEVDRFIQDTLSDPAAQAAISFALRSDPTLTQGASGELLLDLFSIPGLDDGGQGLAAEYGNLYISTTTGAAIASIDSTDPSSVSEAQARIADLNDPRLAAALGVPPGSLASATASLQQALPGLAATDQAELAAAATSLNDSLNAIPGFSSDDVAGQIFRSIAASATGSGQVNALGVPLDDPRVESALDAVIDNIEFLKGGNFTARALISIAVNENLIPAGSLVGRYSALAPTLGGRLFAAVGIAADTWNAVNALGDGDAASGALHLAAAGGALTGLLGAGTWAGPVGWAVAALAYVGLGAIEQAEHNNRFETEAMKQFLAASALSEAAAGELLNTSGNAVSPVPFLLYYADQQGLTPEQAIVYLNDLAEAGELDTVVALAHRAIDTAGDDGTNVPTTHESDRELQESLNGPVPGAVVMAHDPVSLAQMNAMLEQLGIPIPA